MTCREFTSKIESLTLSQLSSADPELVAHQSNCASCAALLQQRSALAGAMQVLHSRTAAMEAPAQVEQNVLRAFRQGHAQQQAASALRVIPRAPGFRLSNLFGWRAYAAAAAVLVIGLGLGLWFTQRSDTTAQQPTAETHEPATPDVYATGNDAQLPVQASASNSNKLHSETDAAVSPHPAVTTAALAQSEQAQGYTPLMLCDPISCSGEEAVVRMQLPATAADGSTGSQMADVIVGDDGLVRAIRIVQQQ